MDRNINSDLFVDQFYNAYRDGWIVPERFCQGAVTPTIRFMIRTQRGGPFEVNAERDERFPRYYFAGPEWVAFIDQNNLRNGDTIVFSSTGPFALDAIILDGYSLSGSFNEQAPNLFDWLVMLKPRTPAIPSEGALVAGHLEGSQTLVPALWDLKLSSNTRWILAVEEVFARKAFLAERGTVAVRNTANTTVIMATFERVAGTCYWTDGFPALIQALSLEIGDKLTFISGINKDRSIYVDVRRGKSQFNISTHALSQLDQSSTSHVRHSGGGRHQSLLTADKNSFSVDYNDSFKDFIPLPRKFLENANIKVGDVINVRQPGAGIWKVQVNVDNAGNFGLHSGWREFVERNHLHVNKLIIFTIPSRLTRVTMQVEIGGSN